MYAPEDHRSHDHTWELPVYTQSVVPDAQAGTTISALNNVSCPFTHDCLVVFLNILPGG